MKYYYVVYIHSQGTGMVSLKTTDKESTPINLEKST